VSREGSKREREEKGRSTSDEIGLSDVALHRHQVMRLPHESYQCTWCDFLMSRVNRTDVTQMNHILKINFGLVHFIIFLKRVKIKKIPEQREPGESWPKQKSEGLVEGCLCFVCLLRVWWWRCCDIPKGRPLWARPACLRPNANASPGKQSNRPKKHATSTNCQTFRRPPPLHSLPTSSSSRSIGTGRSDHRQPLGLDWMIRGDFPCPLLPFSSLSAFHKP
jgi:hypothetical protein